MQRSFIVATLCVAVSACGMSTTSQAEEAVRERLKDPTSAQFRNVRKEGDYVCGEVNAKNGLGGYGDYSDFAFNPRTGETAIRDYGNESLRYNEMCNPDWEAELDAAGRALEGE